MMKAEKSYLGDAVYAAFDGWQIELHTGGGNNQRIYLEPEVMRSLIQYAERIGMIEARK